MPTGNLVNGRRWDLRFAAEPYLCGPIVGLLAVPNHDPENEPAEQLAEQVCPGGVSCLKGPAADHC